MLLARPTFMGLMERWQEKPTDPNPQERPPKTLFPTLATGFLIFERIDWARKSQQLAL